MKNFRQAKGVPSDSTENVSAAEKHPKSRKMRLPSDHWTKMQLFSVFFMNGIGAFVISGGINFAIAYGLYANVNTAKHPVRLWRLPNTLSGDAAVTLFVQTVVTWLITMILANADMRNGQVQPIGFIQEPKNGFLRWFLFLDAEQPIENKSFKQWIVFIGTQITRALIYSVPCFFLIWPAAMGILTSSTLGSHRGNDYYYARRWTPEIFMMLFSGILGLLQTPPMYMFWLITVGWRERRLASTLPVSSSNSARGITSGNALLPANQGASVSQNTEDFTGTQRPVGDNLAPPLVHETV